MILLEIQMAGWSGLVIRIHSPGRTRPVTPPLPASLPPSLPATSGLEVQMVGRSGSVIRIRSLT